ncbi:MAG TPA: hemerythrin domain-containing protein [Blastocatellia bacterium]|nr:hemerythrin domain-containing protein [Blastocatellia bacterium]
MSRPTHILRHEHRVIEQGLRALDGMCLTLKTGGSVPAEALAQMLDFIQNFADRFHHAKEENWFLPALKESGVLEEGGALAFLKKEHEMERHLLAELELATEEYRYGDSAAADNFVNAAVQFRDHLIGHMQQEEAMLFNLAEEMLDEPVKASLIQSFAQENARAGDGVTKRYEQLAEELERKWAV